MATVAVPTAGDPVHASWGEDVADAINDILDFSKVPYALPLGVDGLTNQVTTLSLASVSGGNAGAILVPILVPGPMDVYSYAAYIATASATSAEARLYRDVGSTTLEEVPDTDATFSSSGTGMSTASLAAAVSIGPGIYYLAIRCTHASNNWVLGTAATSTTFSGMNWNRDYSSCPALGATLDISSFSSQSKIPLIRVNGSVFGEAGGF